MEQTKYNNVLKIKKRWENNSITYHISEVAPLDKSLSISQNSTTKVESNDTYVIQQSDVDKKKIRCKYCKDTFANKKDMWQHSREHIHLGKLLECSLCPFVTEYKHHLIYHMRTHTGAKPFKCSVCFYQCVNKSMLNSHMKSHSSDYEFQCSDCSYVAKYKLNFTKHLTRYGHKARVTKDSSEDKQLVQNSHVAAYLEMFKQLQQYGLQTQIQEDRFLTPKLNVNNTVDDGVTYPEKYEDNEVKIPEVKPMKHNRRKGQAFKSSPDVFYESDEDVF